MPAARARPRGVAAAACALTFPVALWLVSTLALGGDLGKYGDDYDFHRRDPVTGAWSAWEILGPRGGWEYFWRPLHVRASTLLQSALWEHDRVNHIITALAHGCAAAMVFVFLRRVRIGARSAAAAAVLFLVHPMTHEVSLWPSAASMAWGTCVLLAGLCVAAGKSGCGLMLIIAFAALSFIAACWYEPPATAMLAAPLAAWCGRAPTEGRRAWGPEARRAISIGIGAVSGLAAYAALVMLNAPPGVRGGVGTFAPVAMWPSRVALVFEQAADLMMLRGFGPGAVVWGWREARSAGGWMISLGVVTAACGAVWVWWFALGEVASRRREEEASTESGPGATSRETSRPVWVLACGVVVAMLALAPVAAVRDQGVAPRMIYVPLAGLAIVMAAVFHAIGGLLPRSAIGRGAAGLMVGALACEGALALVGVQARAQARWRMDRFEVEQVMRLAPAPASDAVFVSLWCRDRVVDPPTGSARFDSPLWGVLELPWSIGHLRFGYGRGDIQGIGSNRFKPPEIERLSAESFVYRGEEPLREPYAPDAGEASLIPWDKALPLMVGEKGGVFFIDEVRVLRADNRDFSVRPAAVEALDLPLPRRRPLAILDPVAPDGLAPIDGWTWSGSGSGAVVFTRVNEEGAWSRAVRMHPETKAVVGRGEVVIPLPAGESAMLHLRAMMPSRQVFEPGSSPLRPRGDGVMIEFTLPGAAEPLATVPVVPQEVEADRGWKPVSIRLPALDRAADLRVRILPGPAGNAAFDAVFLTPAWREPAQR